MGSIGNLDGTGGGGTAQDCKCVRGLGIPSEQDVRSLKDQSLWADEVGLPAPEEHILDEPVQLIEHPDNYLDYPELVAASARATSHQAGQEPQMRVMTQQSQQNTLVFQPNVQSTVVYHHGVFSLFHSFSFCCLVSSIILHRLSTGFHSLPSFHALLSSGYK